MNAQRVRKARQKWNQAHRLTKETVLFGARSNVIGSQCSQVVARKSALTLSCVSMWRERSPHQWKNQPEKNQDSHLACAQYNSSSTSPA